MSRVLDEIVQEVESKAPVLKRQREEYESMQRSMASLCNKLEQARTVWDKFMFLLCLSKTTLKFIIKYIYSPFDSR